MNKIKDKIAQAAINVVLFPIVVITTLLWRSKK